MEPRQKHERFMLGDNLAQGYSKNLRIESECKEEKKEVKKADTDQKILED